MVVITEMAPIPPSALHPYSLRWPCHGMYSQLLTLDLAYDMLWPTGFSADVIQAEKTSLRKRIEAMI